MAEIVDVKIGIANVPPSVEAAMAANKPPAEASGPKTGFRSLRIRVQLLMIYGALTVFAFLLMFLIIASLTASI